MAKNYDMSLEILEKLVLFDDKNSLADNSQFWIGQIYYIQKEYKLAIEEYSKVSKLGDKNKAPDASYKIALSYFNLDMIDEALEYFNIIVSRYPSNINLVNKSKKYIKRYK